MSGDEDGELLAALSATLAIVEQVMEQRAAFSTRASLTPRSGSG
jgi:hypothetical protein